MNRREFVEKKIKKKVQIDDSNADLAFWVYFQLGENRTLNKVAKKLEIPLSTIQYWSKKFKWSEKVKEQEELLNESKQKQKIASLAKIAQIKTYALYMSILEDPEARPADKMKAAEKLAELSEKAEKIKDIKRISIRFPNIENFKEKLKEAGVRVIEENAVAGD